jgi:hypothetical protein
MVGGDFLSQPRPCMGCSAWEWVNEWKAEETSLHVRLKLRPYVIQSPSKISSGVHGRTSLGYWIGMLVYICYKECRYVAGCMSIHSVCVSVGTYLVETMSRNLKGDRNM